MNPELALLKTFYNSFVAYYKSHAAHWNIRSRTFYSDHKLLNKIYEDLFDSVDDLAELIRTLDLELPQTLTEISAQSDIPDVPIFDDGDGDEYLQGIYDDLEILVSSFQTLEQDTQGVEYSHINNYAQDRVRAVKKFQWMLKSTLSDRTHM